MFCLSICTVLKTEEICAFSIAAVSCHLKDFRFYFQSRKSLKVFFASCFFLPCFFALLVIFVYALVNRIQFLKYYLVGIVFKYYLLMEVLVLFHAHSRSVSWRSQVLHTYFVFSPYCYILTLKHEYSQQNSCRGLICRNTKPWR